MLCLPFPILAIFPLLFLSLLLFFLHTFLIPILTFSCYFSLSLFILSFLFPTFPANLNMTSLFLHSSFTFLSLSLLFPPFTFFIQLIYFIFPSCFRSSFPFQSCLPLCFFILFLHFSFSIPFYFSMISSFFDFLTIFFVYFFSSLFSSIFPFFFVIPSLTPLPYYLTSFLICFTSLFHLQDFSFFLSLSCIFFEYFLLLRHRHSLKNVSGICY